MMYDFLTSTKVMAMIMISIAILTGIRTALQVYTTMNLPSGVIKTEKTVITPDSLQIQKDLISDYIPSRVNLT